MSEKLRSISDAELKIIRWLLQCAPTAVGKAYAAASLEGLIVVDQCRCGCASIDFEPSGQDSEAEVIADAVASWPSGIKAGVILWGKEGRITGLEVHDVDPDSAKVLPTVAVLRTWDELGGAQSPSELSPTRHR
jgi:hypothetical protein